MPLSITTTDTGASLFDESPPSSPTASDSETSEGAGSHTGDGGFFGGGGGGGGDGGGGGGGDGAPRMTIKMLRKCALDGGGYATPHLNDKLYLHFKGFTRVSGLAPYTGLRALWLEGNGLSELGGLAPLTQLRCLFVQQNCLTSLDSLPPLPHLDTLNISNNMIGDLSGLAAAAPQLHSLTAARNTLASPAALGDLAGMDELAIVDVSHNGLDGDGPDELLAVLQAMPGLGVLVMSGNPIVRAIDMYRKTLVPALPSLKYLDDRPVFEEERLFAEAYASGGSEAEAAARAQWKEQQDAKARARWESMSELIGPVDDAVVDDADPAYAAYLEEQEALRLRPDVEPAAAAASSSVASSVDDDVLDSDDDEDEVVVDEMEAMD